MKKLLLVVSILFISPLVSAQNDGPTEITPQLAAKLKADIEKQVPALRKKLAAQEMNAVQIEFTIDTMRIERLMSKRIELDYSTSGMNESVLEATDSYDKLLNKYYNKLIKKLQPEDQKVLITTQRAWISFRDAEKNLIDTMTKEEYSGGGSIQSNIAIGSYADIVVTRTLKIFHYYNDVVQNQHP
ncbi:lysozyme inhibitor LprI family protein [Flavobacterium pedocola]